MRDGPQTESPQNKGRFIWGSLFARPSRRRCVLGGVHLTSSPPRWLSLINKGFSLPLCYLNLMGIGCTPPISRLTDSGALYMCRASPVRVESARAEFSYENFLLTLTDNFNRLYDFLTTKLS